MRSLLRWSWWAGVAALALATVPVQSAHAASRVTVTLEPPNFAQNGSAELTITLTGDEDAAPIIPHVPGLVINPDGQSSSIRQVNGTVTATFTRTYRVTASQVGDFSIPPIQVGNAATAPVAVHVGAPGSGNRPRGRTQVDEDRIAPADMAAAMRASMPMMKVVLPKTKLYVGELIPIQIKAYFREGVSARLDGPVAAAGDAFTVGGLEKRPNQMQEVIGGVNYTVLTWSSVLGALKSGDYPIGLEVPVTLNVQLPGADSDMASRLRALFGTSSASAFMDDNFGNLFGRVVQKNITLKPEAIPITVLPLPAGQPADFSGAVGQFEVTGELAPASGAVGDPLNFKLTVTGTGNLSRVKSDALRDSPQWRVYRSSAKVTSEDDNGLKGVKAFSQPVVPMQAGQLTLPAVSFSYFDPEAARYVTRATTPIPVRVAPGVAVPPPAPARGGATVPNPVVNDAAPDGLAPDATVIRGFAATLEPVVWRPWFLGSAVAPILMMLAVVTLIRRYQLRSGDPALALHAARLAAVTINLEAMSAALNRADAAAFFSTARHALQERLADMWQVPAEAVDRQLVAEKMPGEAGAELQAILAMADQATYAGESLAVPALQAWQRRILEQMDRLEAVA